MEGAKCTMVDETDEREKGKKREERGKKNNKEGKAP